MTPFVISGRISSKKTILPKLIVFQGLSAMGSRQVRKVTIRHYIHSGVHEKKSELGANPCRSRALAPCAQHVHLRLLSSGNIGGSPQRRSLQNISLTVGRTADWYLPIYIHRKAQIRQLTSLETFTFTVDIRSHRICLTGQSAASFVRARTLSISSKNPIMHVCKSRP